MSRRTIIVTTSLALLGAVVFAGWWFLFRETAPDPASLEGARTAATSSTQAGSAPETTVVADPPAATETTPAPDEPSGIDGEWAVRADGSSFVGYRVQEELAGIGAKTAAGRTALVSGGITIAGGAVTAVEIEADLTALESDDGRRDGAIRRQALETEAFPTAGFASTMPIDLPAGAAAGEPISVIATGELTLHGVTRVVEVPIEAQLTAGAIVMAGSLPILFADYDIEKPRAAVVLSVEDNGIMEFELVLDPG